MNKTERDIEKLKEEIGVIKDNVIAVQSVLQAMCDAVNVVKVDLHNKKKKKK